MAGGGEGSGVIRGAFARIFGTRAPPEEPVALDDARVMVQSPDAAIRRRVAEDPDAQPELLYYLARDLAPSVRRAVAKNSRTPRQADLILALDDVPEVRRLVAEKITAEVAELSHSDAAQIWQMTIAVLEALARDDAPRVRQLVAETARSVGRIPSSLATSLGKDQESSVAVPALGYPGTIADTDLVEIVEKAPSQQVVGAVAKRPSIGPTVSDAVVNHGDEPTIEILLQNTTAQIRPTTMDRVIDRAPPIEIWHEPLVNRPSLTDENAVKLAGFVAEKLVQALQERRDLDSSTTAALTTLLAQRNNPSAPAKPTPAAPARAPNHDLVRSPPRSPGKTPGELSLDSAISRARRHHADGTLNEELILDAIGSETDFIIAALSLRSRLPPAVVAKIMVSHSAKGLTALVWRSGYSMRLAIQLQLRHAKLPLKSRLNAGSGGTYPLTPAEMEWQIEFFKSLVPAGI